MAEENLDVLEISPNTSKNSGVVIFLHGACDTGRIVAQVVKEASDDTFHFDYLRILYPSAPERMYTRRAKMATVWFDWPDMDPELKEDLPSIDAICSRLRTLVLQLVNQGCPSNRIIIGGMSMGGATVLHLAYRHLVDLPIAGVFALSTFLNNESDVYKVVAKQQDSEMPPLFMAHGKTDTVIKYEWGKTVFDQLQQLGIPGEFHSYDNLPHSMCKPELELLKAWITQRLPPIK